MEASAATAAPTGADAMSGDSAFEQQVNAAQAEHDAQQADKPQGESADEGKLFELPKIKVDQANPTVLKTAFSGSIEIERNDKQWAEVFNSLTPGKSHELRVTVFCAGGRKTHRRDSEGDVDAVVQVKSLIVTDIHDPSDDA